MQIASGGPRRSKLWVVGWVLTVGNFVAQTGVRSIQKIPTLDSPTHVLLGFGADLLIVAGFAGLACVIIGGLRNRNWQREWERSRTP